MAVFNTSFANKAVSCTNGGNPDPETGCVACGENAQSVYEQCRQTFFLKEQTKIDQARLENELSSTVQSSTTATQTNPQTNQNIPPLSEYSSQSIVFFVGLILAAFVVGYLLKGVRK